MKILYTFFPAIFLLSCVNTSLQIKCEHCMNIPICPAESEQFFVDLQKFSAYTKRAFDNESEIRNLVNEGVGYVAICFKLNTKIYHGSVNTWYENGNKQYEENFINDLKHGKSKFWYKNGVLSRVINFHNGSKVGDEIFYYKTGVTAAIFRYRQNREVKSQYNDENGNVKEFDYEMLEAIANITCNYISECVVDYMNDIRERIESEKEN